MLSRIFRRLPNPNEGQMKLALVVRGDLKMSKGKTAAQCSHAAIMCYQKSLEMNPKVLETWCKWGQPKVVLRVNTVDDIYEIQDKATKMNLVSQVVRDAGRTQLEVGTITVLGIGPDENVWIDQLVRHLKLL